MNLNITSQPDYDLQGSLTAELINLYGIPIKLIITEKRNYDQNVFGDFQSIKANKEDIFDLYGLPENSEEVEDMSSTFSEFGMLNLETIRLFISKESLEEISYQNMTAKDEEHILDTEPQPKEKRWGDDYYINDGNTKGSNYEFINSDFRNTPVISLQSNLVVLPNNRMMEISEVKFMVPGINNLFTQKDEKNVYQITLKPYSIKVNDNIEELNNDDLTNNDTEPDLVGSYKELDSYFDELTDNHNAVESEAKDEINRTTEKVVEVQEDSVFGRF